MSPEWQLHYAQILARCGQQRRGIELIGVAYESDPILQNGYARLGGIRREAGDWAGAKELMSRDFECDRMSCAWKLRYAEVLAEVGDEEAGLALVLQVYQQEPEAMDGYARLGWVKARRRDWEAAAELMGKDWQLRRMSPEWQLHYAQILARCGQEGKAIELIGMAYESDPTLQNAYARLGTMHQRDDPKLLPIILRDLQEHRMSLPWQLRYADILAKLESSQSRSHPHPSTEIHKHRPLLSIVMPIYNVERYLDASLLSVLGQDFTDFEVIAVNDASSDNSAKILQLYRDMDDRIRIVDLDFNTLGGPSSPSNVGIKHAVGKYVGFVDSDDFVERSAFRTMIDAAEHHNADVVISDFHTFDDATRDLHVAYDRTHWEGIPLDTPVSPLSVPALFRLSPVPWRKLYLRSLLQAESLLFPEGDYFYEDNPFHWFVLSSARRVE